MRTIMVRLPAAGFSAAMETIRDWLDQNRCEPSKFKYDQESEAVVLSVEFLDDQQGEAFAKRFDHREHTRQRQATAEAPTRRKDAVGWSQRKSV